MWSQTVTDLVAVWYQTVADLIAVWPQTVAGLIVVLWPRTVADLIVVWSRTVTDLIIIVEGFSFIDNGKGLLRWFKTPFVDISEVWLEAFCFSHFVDIFEGFSFVEVGVDVMPCYSEGKK